MSTERSRKPSDLFPIKADDTTHEAAGPASMSTFQMWRTAISRPSVELYEAIAQHPNAKIKTALIWIARTSLVVSATLVLIELFIVWSGNKPPGNLSPTLLSEPSFVLSLSCVLIAGLAFASASITLIFALSVGVLHLFARMLGGQGTYRELIYVTGSFVAPLIIIVGVLSFFHISEFLVLSISAYLFGLTLVSLRAVYRFRVVKACVVALLSIALMFIPYQVIRQGVTQISSLTAEGNRNMGNIYLDRKAYHAALDAYTQAIALNPTDAEAHNNRGLAYDALGQYDKAIADFTQAISLDPKLAVVYNNRGLAYWAQARYDKALTDFNQALALDPKYAHAYSNRGLAYDAQGQYEKAIADFTQAIVLDPKLADAYYNRARSYHFQGKHEKAIADFTQAITLNPNYGNAYYNRGYVYALRGQYDEAILDFTQALALDPQLAEAHLCRGYAYDQQGQFTQALADYRRYAELVGEANVPSEIRQRIAELEK